MSTLDDGPHYTFTIRTAAGEARAVRRQKAKRAGIIAAFVLALLVPTPVDGTVHRACAAANIC